jgi:hypothetical protein
MQMQRKELLSVIIANQNNKKTYGAIETTYQIFIACFFYRGFFFWTMRLWHCGHSWPIVPASGDNEDDCGEHDGM